jgi:glyoxylase-like metal-dependent hydrolase (beta-lactamase superfamily II)
MSAQLPDPIKIVTKKAGDVCIYTFISAFTDNNIANATHIIEGKRNLVLVDGQFLASYARQFRDYANGLAKDLGKPIERLYLSHRHPDHWFGLGTAFEDVAAYALPETVDFLKERGEASREDHLKIMGPEAPGKVVIPGHTVRLDEKNRTSEETIDGVRYIFGRETDTEIDFLLTISLPDLGVFIAQDLIYSRTHLYLPSAPTVQDATKKMEHWIQVLGELLKSDYDLFMPGHGFPADKTEVAQNIEYLAAAKHAIDCGLTKYDFKSFMLQRYPERKCPGIFTTYLQRLFDGVRDY